MGLKSLTKQRSNYKRRDKRATATILSGKYLAFMLMLSL